ncbi:MAG: hypothetical protein JJT87_19405 [Halomonas sp.]|nr:hypothetical protein [Halomonas sp.]MCC5904084.1 hypothetical protein [Halomonas sp.]
MIDAQIVHGTEINNLTGLPQLTITPLDIAVGSIGYDWAMLLDPDWVDEDGSRARNMPRRFEYGVSFGSSENPSISTGTFPSGARSFYAAQGGGAGFGMSAPGRPNANAWSWVGVAKIEPGTPMRMYANNSSIANTGDIGIYIAISNTGSTLTLFEKWLGSAGINVERLQATVNLQNDTAPSLLEVDFSVGRGITILKNGVVLAQNANDTRPLDLGLNAGDNSALIGARGHHGINGLLNFDLSHPSRVPERRAIEEFAAWQYDIPTLKAKYPQRPAYFDMSL